jgi:hypothetical protein
MIPVQQTRFKDGGNCFSACLASILELAIGVVPNFAEKGERWFDLAQAWLAKRGLRLVAVPAHELAAFDVEDWAETVAGEAAVAWWIAAGPGPRGRKHAVVMRGSDVVHDPHPDGGGLERITWAYVIEKREGTS